MIETTKRTGLWLEVGGDGTFDNFELHGVHYEEIVDVLRESMRGGGNFVVSGIDPDGHRFIHSIPLDRFRIRLYEAVCDPVPATA